MNRFDTRWYLELIFTLHYWFYDCLVNVHYFEGKKFARVVETTPSWFLSYY